MSSAFEEAAEMVEVPEAGLIRGRGIWEHYTVLDGLPDMKIECLAEDRKGAIWIGTHDRGVARFDGETFTCYDSADGLSGDSVYSITEDHSGHLWFATNRGLTRYDGTTFEVIQSSLAFSFLWGSCIDEEGCLWFGLERDPDRPVSVCKWNGETLELIQASDDRGKSVHAMALIGDTIIALGHTTHCVRGSSLQPLPWCIRDTRALVRETPDTGIAVGGRGFFRVTSNSATRISSETYGESVASDGSIVCVATIDGRVVRLAESGIEDEPAPRHSSFWRGLLIDSNGRRWFSSYGGGLIGYDERAFGIIDESELPSARIQCVEFDESGLLWIATNKGLRAIDKRKNLLAPPQGHILHDGEVTSLLCDTGCMWVGARNGIVYRIEGRLIEQVGAPRELEGLSISEIVRSDKDIIYCGKATGTLGKLLPEPQIIENIESTPIENVCALAPRAGGGYWIGMRGGVNRGQLSGVLSSGRIDRHFELPLTPTVVWESDRTIWIGTIRGLFRIDPESGFQAVPCVVQAVTCIEGDNSGGVWVGTEGGGLHHLNNSTSIRIALPTNVSGQVVNDMSICPVDGTRVVGTNAGIVFMSGRKCRPHVDVQDLMLPGGAQLTEPVHLEAANPSLSVRLKARSRKWRPADMSFRWKTRDSDSWVNSGPQFVVGLGDRGDYEICVQAIDPDLLLSDIRRILVHVEDDARMVGYQAALKSRETDSPLVGQSPQMQDVLANVQRVAGTDLPVLVLGESGTGKSIIARRIHELSERRDGPFIQVNCGGLNPSLIDSELFGHEKGAYTGAVRSRAGAFELADKGTIFLDEIGELPTECQARLLHVLQDGSVRRLGADRTIRVDSRVIAATNRDLHASAMSGAYRQDLYFRLAVFSVVVPPLRERPSDIASLAEWFVRNAADRMRKEKPSISAEAIEEMLRHNWPGNVRELEHAMLSAVLVAHGVIEVPHLPIPTASDSDQRTVTLTSLDHHQREYIEQVLEFVAGRVEGPQGAAKILGVNPSTLRSRMRRLGIKAKRWSGAAK